MKSLKHSRLFAIVLVVLFASGCGAAATPPAKERLVTNPASKLATTSAEDLSFVVALGDPRTSTQSLQINKAGEVFLVEQMPEELGKLIAGTPIVKSSGNTATMEITLLQNREFPDKTTLTSGDVISA